MLKFALVNTWVACLTAMGGYAMDLALLLFLILLNGVFAMSEIAVVSSRKARLQRLADDGSPGAQSALALNNDPSSFLSTIQVGITSVGILSGAIGETVLADPMAAWLSGFGPIAPYAKGIALTIVVVGLTYFPSWLGNWCPSVWPCWPRKASLPSFPGR